MALRYALALLLIPLIAGCGAPHAPPPSSGTRLYLAGDGELWVVDVARERVRRLELPRLAPGDPPYRIVRRGDEIVVYGGTTYRLEGRSLRALVRGSWFFLPSAHPDRVWTTFLDPRSPATVNALRAVREVAVDGRVTVPDVRPPGGRWPERAVMSGLLVGMRDGGMLIWDPATRARVRRLPPADYGPTSRNLIASCPYGRCRALALTDARSGAVDSVPAPRGTGFEVWSGAFSPDGATLAVPVRSGGRRRLALVDVGRRTATVVAGSRVPPGYVFVAWSAAGDQVFVSGGARFSNRTLVAYRPGAPRAITLDVEVGDFYGMAAR